MNTTPPPSTPPLPTPSPTPTPRHLSLNLDQLSRFHSHRYPWPWLYPALALVWTLLIAYGSLMPFDLHFPHANTNPQSSFFSPIADFLSSPQWIPKQSLYQAITGKSKTLRDDAILNLIVYLPIGLLLRLSDRRRNRHDYRVNFLILFLLFALSWLIECLQGLSPSRVPSLNDILSNFLGGTLGLIIAPFLARIAKAITFYLYCKLAYPIYLFRIKLARERRQPILLILITCFNLLLICLWYWLQTHPPAPYKSKPDNWLPFANQFDWSWSRTARHFAQSLLIYITLTLLLSLQFISIRRRRGITRLVLLVTALACIMQWFLRIQTNRHWDITEPLLALTACILVLTTAAILYRAVHRSCRRIKPSPVSHDRRRIRHIYRP